jgi:hypothetical protein
MFLCYVDESGTPSIPGNTSHYVLAGISIPIKNWVKCDQQINNIKSKYLPNGAEIHTAWILRSYLEQSKIEDFENLDPNQRIRAVKKERKKELLRLQRTNKNQQLKQVKKNYNKTNDYIHLTHEERKAFIYEVATQVSKWRFARLFAECIDKVFYDPTRGGDKVEEQAFEQIVSRFETYLKNMGSSRNVDDSYGLLIHDNNETVAKRHTYLMQNFQQTGTLWTSIENIIETPLFVDSQLTCMVQIADLCSYAIRRYLENQESELFDLVYKRADRKNNYVVGVRHFTENSCKCKICSRH